MATGTAVVKVKQRKDRSRLLLCVVVTGILFAAVLFYFRPGLYVAGVQRLREWRMGLRQEWVVLDGHKIHYIVAGQGSPIVLVHGLGGRSEDWLSLVPVLTSSGYKVYALDLLGYGRSARPDVDYSISLEEQVLKEFLDSQGLMRPDLAGWSMGGWISLKFAADHPDRVHDLVLLDSAGLRFDAVNAPLLRPKTEAGLEKMMQVLTPHPPHIPSFYARDLLRDMGREDWIIDRALKSMYSGKDLMDGRMAAVNMPVLLVWGKQDVLTPPSIGEQMHRAMPNSVFVTVDGCGHLAPVECSSQVSRWIIGFLKGDGRVGTPTASVNFISYSRIPPKKGAGP